MIPRKIRLKGTCGNSISQPLGKLVHRNMSKSSAYVGTDQNGKIIFLGKLQCEFYTQNFNYVVYLKP